jgi:ComF family protein
LRRAGGDLLEWLLPQPCLGCGLPGEAGLCRGCAAELPWNHHACARCALPLPAADRGRLCGHCLRRAPPAASCCALLRYADPIDRWIGALKFDRRLAAGSLLSRLLYERLHAQLPAAAVDAVLVMPLHPLRLRQRGFNQVLELLRPLRRQLPAPLNTSWLQRQRATAPQSGLDAAHRRRNLRGAFRAAPDVRGQHLLLVDDVITTGSTVNEAARCLLAAGAAQVHVLGWARVAAPVPAPVCEDPAPGAQRQDPTR